MVIDEKFLQILGIYQGARYPYVWMVTQEETRSMEMISKVATQNNLECFVWDDMVNWKRITSWLVGSREDTRKIPEVLNASSLIDSFQNLRDYDDEEYGEALFVYPDFHLEFQRANLDPLTIIRTLKWLAPRLAERGLLVIMLSHSRGIPHELSDLIHIEEVERPLFEELYTQLEKILVENSQVVQPSEEIMEQVARAALGLSRNQADRLFAKAIVSNSKKPEKWTDTVTHGKKGIIGSMEALDYYSPKELRDDLAGLKILKDWLNLRKRAFTKEADEYFLPKPKGVGLIGIPGTGKSLTAKFVAAKWHLPLIRFDIGAVFGSYVGQSEETMRNALNIAETIAPCVVWIDEIEKAFPKDISGGDAGTSTRVLASFLTWMQEKRAPVFVVATANDVEKLPPELLRKGRFDEIFFLNIPTEEERREIFNVHINRVKRDPHDFDVRRFAKRAKNFVGAEIEEVVKSALYLAFADEGREPYDDDFINTINATYPLYETRKNDLQKLQELVDNRQVVNASDITAELKKDEAPARRPKLETKG